MPSDRPNTTVAEVRCDRRVLASIAIYYSKNANRPKSTSDLLRLIIYDYHDLLVKHEIIKEITSTTEAVEILNGLKFHNLNRSGRGIKVLAKQISKESLANLDDMSEFISKLDEIETDESSNL